MHLHAHILKGFIAAALLFPSPSESAPATIINNVRIIPMDTEGIVDGMAVIVENGRISAIVDEATLSPPPGARLIDGQGGYLIPGLADMHTHLASYDADPAHLMIYLAFGVTTVRAMSGTPENLSWRERVAEGALEGPAIYSSGPVLSGLFESDFGIEKYLKVFHAAVFLMPIVIGSFVFLFVLSFRRIRYGIPILCRGNAFKFTALLAVLAISGYFLMESRVIPFMSVGRFIISPDYYISENPAQASREVSRQKEEGYDCLKVYDHLTLEEYRASLMRASEIGFYVTGHLPDQVPLDVAILSGQDEIAHIDELQSYHWTGYGYGAGEYGPEKDRRFEFDYEAIPETVALVKESGMGAVSTLVVKETMFRLIQDPAKVLSGPEYRLIRKEHVEQWRTGGKSVTSLKDYGDYRRSEMQPFLLELTRQIHSAGVTIVIGTDTGNEGMVPGYHLHREMEILVEAGLTPFEALETGTRNAGVIVSRMGSEGDFGVIEAGMRADLVLLEDNPLEDISNTRKIAGVMAEGRWYGRSELEERLSSFLKTY